MYLHSSAYRHIVRPAPSVEDAFFFPLWFSSFFIKNQVSIDVWIYVWVFDLINMSVFMPVPWRFYYCHYVVYLDISNGDIPEVLLLCRMVSVLAIFVFVLFIYLFVSIWNEYCPIKVRKELCWNFDGDCTESVDCFH